MCMICDALEGNNPFTADNDFGPVITFTPHSPTLADLEKELVEGVLPLIAADEAKPGEESLTLADPSDPTAWQHHIAGLTSAAVSETLDDMVQDCLKKRILIANMGKFQAERETDPQIASYREYLAARQITELTTSVRMAIDLVAKVVLLQQYSLAGFVARNRKPGTEPDLTEVRELQAYLEKVQKALPIAADNTHPDVLAAAARAWADKRITSVVVTTADTPTEGPLAPVH